MIVIEENNLVSKWLKQVDLNEIGHARIDLATFELAQGFETELVLIQDTVYHQLTTILKDKLNNVAGVLVFNSTESPLQFYLDKVVGVLSPSTSADLVRNQITFLEELLKGHAVLKSQLITLNRELMETIGGVETQLLRVKKVYEHNTPKRLETFKGFSIYSKYAAGQDMGGEFFDVFSKEGKVFILMSASSSFLASSSIIEYFSELKNETEIDKDLEQRFINNIKLELLKINQNKKKPVEVQLLTCIMDMNTMKLEGHAFGEFYLVSSNDSHQINTNTQLDGEIQNAAFTIKLERGERILLNSPGFIKNWDTAKIQINLNELIQKEGIKPLDVLDEIYFQLKKESRDGFLPHDASSIIMEVQQNVMVKV